MTPGLKIGQTGPPAEQRARLTPRKLQGSLSGTFLQTVRIGSATEGALFISAQLSPDAVSALRKAWLLTNKSVEATYARKYEARPPRIKKK